MSRFQRIMLQENAEGNCEQDTKSYMQIYDCQGPIQVQLQPQYWSLAYHLPLASKRMPQPCTVRQWNTQFQPISGIPARVGDQWLYEHKGHKCTYSRSPSILHEACPKNLISSEYWLASINMHATRTETENLLVCTILHFNSLSDGFHI